jgi:hypothetical protein
MTPDMQRGEPMLDHESHMPHRGTVPPVAAVPDATRVAARAERREHDAAVPVPPKGTDEPTSDVVHDASVESFPASDPPSWIGMRMGQPRREVNRHGR